MYQTKEKAPTLHSCPWPPPLTSRDCRLRHPFLTASMRGRGDEEATGEGWGWWGAMTMRRLGYTRGWKLVLELAGYIKAAEFMVSSPSPGMPRRMLHTMFSWCCNLFSWILHTLVTMFFYLQSVFLDVAHIGYNVFLICISILNISYVWNSIYQVTKKF